MRCSGDSCGCMIRPEEGGSEACRREKPGKKQWLALVVVLVYMGFVLVTAFTMEDIVTFTIKTCVATILMFIIGFAVKGKKTE